MTYIGVLFGIVYSILLINNDILVYIIMVDIYT